MSAPIVTRADQGSYHVRSHKSASYYIPVPFTQTTAAVVTQDQVHYLALPVGGGWAIDRIGIWVTVGGAANSVLRFGLFNSDVNGQPGTVLEDLGTVAVDTTAIPAPAQAVVTPSGGSRVLTPNTIYWLGIVGQNLASPGTGITMPTVNRVVIVPSPHAVVYSTTNISSSVTGAAFYIQATVTGVFATAVPALTSTHTAPMVVVRTL